MKKFATVVGVLSLACLIFGHIFQTEIALVYHGIKIVMEDRETREILKRDLERHGLLRFKELLVWLFDGKGEEVKISIGNRTIINSEPVLPVPVQPMHKEPEQSVPIQAATVLPPALAQTAVRAPGPKKVVVKEVIESPSAQAETSPAPKPVEKTLESTESLTSSGEKKVGPRKKPPLRGERARIARDRAGIPENESIKYAGESEDEEFRVTWGPVRWDYAFYRRDKGRKDWKEFKPIHASHGRPDSKVCTLVLPETPSNKFRGGLKSPHITLQRIGEYEFE